MDTGTSMAHKRLRRGYWGLTGRWCCQHLCNMLVVFRADKGLAERFLLLKSTLFTGDSRGWVFACCFFFSLSERLVSSHSHCTRRERCTHTSSKSSFFPSLSFCSVCLSLLHYCTDFRLLSRLINKREVAHSHVLANWWGRKGVLFSERGRMLRYFKSEWQLDASVLLLKTWYGVCSGCRICLCAVVGAWAAGLSFHEEL